MNQNDDFLNLCVDPCFLQLLLQINVNVTICPVQYTKLAMSLECVDMMCLLTVPRQPYCQRQAQTIY